jgi:hypothetical protein
MKAILGPIVIVVFVVALWAVFSRGNPGDISDARYSEYKQLAPPKLLYSCTRRPTRESLLQQERQCRLAGRAGCEVDAYESGETKSEIDVEFVAGPQTSGYDHLLQKAKNGCATIRGDMGGGEFKVLEASKN